MKKVENCLKKGCQGCHISKSCPGNFDLHTSNSSIYHPCSWGTVKIHWNESDPRNEQCGRSTMVFLCLAMFLFVKRTLLLIGHLCRSQLGLGKLHADPKQNHCATCLLTCKNQKSRYVKVWHRSVLRCSVALVRFCRSDLHCLSPNLGDYLLAETGACHLKSSRQNFDIWAPNTMPGMNL